MYPQTPAVMTRDSMRRTVRSTTGTNTFGWDRSFDMDRGDVGWLCRLDGWTAYTAFFGMYRDSSSLGTVDLSKNTF